MVTSIAYVYSILWLTMTFCNECSSLSPKMVHTRTICRCNDWLSLCGFSGSSLLWVAALGMIVIYNYAVGTFVFMPNEFDSQEEGEVVRYCQTLFECSVTVLEYGLLDTIGLVSYIP